MRGVVDWAVERAVMFGRKPYVGLGAAALLGAVGAAHGCNSTDKKGNSVEMTPALESSSSHELSVHSVQSQSKEVAAPSSSAQAAPSSSAVAGEASTAVAEAKAEGPCPIGMALIPEGSFHRQKRRGQSHVKAFCLDIREVRVSAYKACVNENKCSPECLQIGQCSAVPTQARWGDVSESLRASQYCNGDREDRQDHPVNCVSFEESEAYCKAYTKRLPTADEWEWASRGAKPKQPYPWGYAVAWDQLCWAKPDVKSGTCASGAIKSDVTAQGIVDLGGNVSEWVSGEVDEKGVLKAVRLVFGASWYSMDDGYVRAAMGGVEMPSERNEVVGFRCAKDVDTAP